MTKERRKNKRFKLQCSVYYNEYQPRLDRESMLKADLVNISLGGALIECEKKFVIGELVILEVNLIGWQHFHAKKSKGFQGLGRSDCLRVNATVVRTEDVSERKFRMGLKFEAIKSHDQEILREYISKRAIFEL